MCGLDLSSPLSFFSKNKEVKIIAKKDLFINDEIRVREVRLVGLEGEQLGIKPLSEAQAIADDANVDLVLIQPQATPPVAKIMDYGKFKFEYQKKQKNNVKNKALLLLRKFVLAQLLIKGILKQNFVTVVSSLKKVTKLKFLSDSKDV